MCCETRVEMPASRGARDVSVVLNRADVPKLRVSLADVCESDAVPR
jgi:hypothetical protein